MALSNTTQRVLVAAAAIPVILAACYFGNLFFFLFILAIALISYYEFYSFTKNKNANANLWLGEAILFTLLLNQYHFFVGYFSFFLMIVFLISLVELFRNNGSAILNIGTTFLGIFYIGLFSSSIIGIREFYSSGIAMDSQSDEIYLHGGYLIISILATIWICDSAAFYGGTALGKHKLFPRVSPNKSWEGAIFGFIFAVLTMILAHAIVLNFLPLTEIIIFGIIIGTIGQAGDLVESLLKRDAGVKDSSNLIPGHGGLFDRFDSLLFSAPVILLVLKYFAK
ncbi:MAG: phosphatidate cytidylyltransferase [Ignavibacteriaceae bacterium]